MSPDEFKLALSRWLHDSKTATRFIKYEVMSMAAQQMDLTELVVGLIKQVEQLGAGTGSAGRVTRSTSPGAESTLKSVQANENSHVEQLAALSRGGTQSSVSSRNSNTAFSDEIALERKVRCRIRNAMSGDARCNREGLEEPNSGLLLAAQDARSSLQAVLSNLEQALAAGLPQSPAKPQEEGAGLRTMIARADAASLSAPEFEDASVDFAALAPKRNPGEEPKLPPKALQNFGPVFRPAERPAAKNTDEPTFPT